MSDLFVEITLNPSKLFDLYLSGRGISSQWVADNLDVSCALISAIRSGKIPLTEKMRQKINELLETNY